MANFRRFHAYSRKRGRPLSLTYCLMVPNWHEFGAFLRFADEWECPVFVNTVVFPEELSLYRLPASTLDDVLAALEREGQDLDGRLVRNASVWDTELTRLRNWRRRLEDRVERHGGRRLYFEGRGDGPSRSASPTNPLPASFGPPDGAPLDPEAAVGLLADEEWLGAPSVLVLDADRRIVAVEADQVFLGVDLRELAGRPFDDLLQALEGRYGSTHRVVAERIDDRSVQRRVVFEPAGGGITEVRLVVFPNHVASGDAGGSTTVAVRVAPSGLGAQPVALRRRA
jgi:hypothetical protein